MTITILTTILILLCLLIVLLVMLQRSSGGMGSALGGGAADQVLGAGSAAQLTKYTVWSILGFFVLSFALYYFYQSEAGSNQATRLNQDKSGVVGPSSGGGLGTNDGIDPEGENSSLPDAFPEANGSESISDSNASDQGAEVAASPDENTSLAPVSPVPEPEEVENAEANASGSPEANSSSSPEEGN